jgi:hypothetical protein
LLVLQRLSQFLSQTYQFVIELSVLLFGIVGRRSSRVELQKGRTTQGRSPLWLKGILNPGGVFEIACRLFGFALITQSTAPSIQLNKTERYDCGLPEIKNPDQLSQSGSFHFEYEEA